MLDYDVLNNNLYSDLRYSCRFLRNIFFIVRTLRYELMKKEQMQFSLVMRYTYDRLRRV